MADGTITITLTLTPTPQGYHLKVSADPLDCYPETVVDACQRAATHYEHQAVALATCQALDQIRVAREQQRRILHG